MLPHSVLVSLCLVASREDVTSSARECESTVSQSALLSMQEALGQWMDHKGSYNMVTVIALVGRVFSENDDLQDCALPIACTSNVAQMFMTS